MSSFKVIFFLIFSLLPQFGNCQSLLTPALAQQLSVLPLLCIPTEFPNKTSHLADSREDAQLLPHQLHPVFYGCLDWHSSVHGHWMLVKLLKEFPDLANKEEIIAVLNHSFQVEKMSLEAEYFGKYTASNNFERTYGWAWLLKLDLELRTWKDNENAARWLAALKPLTDKIVVLWKAYLPKQTYPSRVGTHSNTAFGLCFALDWAKQADPAFAQQIEGKAMAFYGSEEDIPAYLEPDGSDFFSPSLETADLMRRVLPQKSFVSWLEKYFSLKSITRLMQKPEVSDRNDYHIVHLDGLSFSRAWCMKGIAAALPLNHPWKMMLGNRADRYIKEALPEIISGGYGGAHWLASFAIYSMTVL